MAEAIRLWKKEKVEEPKKAITLGQYLREKGITDTPFTFTKQPTKELKSIFGLAKVSTVGEGIREPKETMEFPVTEEGLKKIRELKAPPAPTISTAISAPTMFLASLSELIDYKISEEKEKEKELARYKILHPERYSKLNIYAPLRYDSMTRNQLLESGEITEEEARIFARHEVIIPFIGMGGGIPKGSQILKNLTKRAKTFKSGKDFANMLAKDFKMNITKLDIEFRNMGVPSAEKFWEMATKKTNALINIYKPVVPSKPIAKSVKPFVSKELQPLAQEARKFKSAEEWIPKKDIIGIGKNRFMYHTSQNPNIIQLVPQKGARGVFFTKGEPSRKGFVYAVDTTKLPKDFFKPDPSGPLGDFYSKAVPKEAMIPLGQIKPGEPNRLVQKFSDFYNQAVKGVEKIKITQEKTINGQELITISKKLSQLKKGERISEKEIKKPMNLGETESQVIKDFGLQDLNNKNVHISKRAMLHIISEESRGKNKAQLIFSKMPDIVKAPSDVISNFSRKGGFKIRDGFLFAKMNSELNIIVVEVAKENNQLEVKTAGLQYTKNEFSKIKQQVINAGGTAFHSEKNRIPLIDEISKKEIPPQRGRISDFQQKPTVPQKTTVESRIAKPKKSVKGITEKGIIEPPPVTAKEEAEFRKIAEVEFAKVEKQITGQLFKDIRELGGLKTVKGFEEEMAEIPTRLRNNKGVAPDEMASSLKEKGYRFDSDDDLIEAITDIEKITRPISKRFRTIKRMRIKTPQLVSETDIERLTKIAKFKVEKVKTAKEILDRRRSMIKATQKQFGLSDKEIKDITRRDIRLLTNFEFKKLLDDIRVKAEKLAEKTQAMAELQQQIMDKELDVENLRKAMKLPSLKNMTTSDIRKLDEVLKPFYKGDVFLSIRKLETVDRTELKGIKTWREARERLAKKLGVDLEDVSNIKVSEWDRFRWDVPLARQNPFYGMMVEETAKRMLVSEAEYLVLEKKAFRLAKGLKPGLFVPQYKNVIEYMEAPADAKPNLTPQEFELVKFMTQEFEKAREYLVKIEAMKLGKENYFTHIRRGILEVVKEDGVINAVKEVFIHYKQIEQNFEILDRVTGEIMALDKFFKFAMHRTGGIIPTQNAVKAFLAYMRTFKTKQALDEIVPLIDIYANALTPRQTTKTGVLLHGNLVRFVKEWLNTQKGRHITLAAKQGGKIDMVLRSIKLFTSLRDLGINIPVSIATEVGEQITTYQLLGKKKFIIGKMRQNTAQGKAIIEKHRNLVGKNPWTELVEPAKTINDRLMEGIFILFRDSSVRANKTFLLGSLTFEEYSSGIISSGRLAKLQVELGRYRMVRGSKSIIGATPEGKSWSQYKTWALPILSTTLNNIKNIGKVVSKVPSTKKVGTKSLVEIYRAIEITAFVLMIRYLAGHDEDDDSFVGTMINKAYREATTLLQALQPTLWLSAGRTASFLEDLGEAILQIALWEKYKTKEGLKGVEKLKRVFKPTVIKQFEGEKKKPSGRGIPTPKTPSVPKVPVPKVPKF